MGFGIMVLGCLFLATARYSGLDLLPDFIGFLILFKGISVADKYCDHFKLSKKLSLAGIIVDIACLYTSCCFPSQSKIAT